MTYVVLDGGKLICTKLYEREIYIFLRLQTYVLHNNSAIC